MTNSTSNNQNNTNMTNLTFTASNANPRELTPHPILVEMGYGRIDDDVYFIETMKYFNHYDKPVVDSDNNVITHWSDVQAAVANDVADMEVYKVDMTVIHLRRFIAMKHRYHRMDLIASYNTAMFFEKYLTEDAEGIRLAESIGGKTTRENIALLMQTSDSTIARLKDVGLNAFDKLGLIEQGHASFKEVRAKIKADRMAAETAKRMAAQLIEPLQQTTVAPNAEYVEPVENLDENVMTALPEEYYEPTLADEVPEPIQSTEPYYENSEENEIEKKAKPLFEDFNCMFSSEGLGQFEINVTDNVPTVKVNGKELKNMSYEVLVDEKDSNGTVHSFVLSQPGKNALCFQLTVENVSKAA